MRYVELYIGDKKVDLDDQSFLLFNYTMEDLSNPTIVKNSFSKQITLKGTPNNNEIFGHAYRNDRKTNFGSGSTGVDYDPLRKTPFSIYNEIGQILESGYVKMDSIEKTILGVEYKVTLYGGLGSLFYGLTYDADGNKRTLSGLSWKQRNTIGELKGFALNKIALCSGAWTYLEEGESYFNGNPNDIWDIINFAPCYNGIPSDFDSNKVLFNSTFYYPFGSEQMSATIDGKSYTKKSGCSSVLATLSQKHTEWEIRSIIPYLQRPVIRLSAILTAIQLEANAMGIELIYDDYLTELKFFKDTWVTLPLLKKEDRHLSNVVGAILQSSLTPCDYLLSFAKMCGAIFLYDPAHKRITLMQKGQFFKPSEEDIIDLTDRIDINNISITPLLTSSKWYRMGGDKVVGEDAESYREKYGREYGEQRINTGYEFNSEISPLTKDIPFIGAAEVTERNRTFGDCWMPFQGNIHPVSIFEEVKVMLYYEGEETQEVAHYIPIAQDVMYYWGDTPQADWLPKMQFHQAENKSVSGEHCLLFFDGWKTTPESGYRLNFFVGDDHPDIATLNDNVPCWNLDNELCMKLEGLPSFRRVSQGYSLDWGLPLETYTENSLEGVIPLYDIFWKGYLTDRYDVDGRVMRCKVNLAGMKVGQELMRHFFFYDNTIWALNKIENYSMTTTSLTDCEFVKVKQIGNYL